MADNIEEFKDNIKMFKALKQMNRKPYETPMVHDANGKMISNPQDVYDAIKTHFENHFHKPEFEDLKMFESEVPKALTKPATLDETRKAINKLNNNRAAGYDYILPELLKYGPLVLTELITLVINNIFEKHELVTTNKGMLAAL